MALMGSTLAFVYPMIINFYAVDFSECGSSDKFILTLGVSIL